MKSKLIAQVTVSTAAIPCKRGKCYIRDPSKHRYAHFERAQITNPIAIEKTFVIVPTSYGVNAHTLDDIRNFFFCTFQTQRTRHFPNVSKGYERLVPHRPCTHPKTALKSICKSKKKKLSLHRFKRNSNQTEFKLHSLNCYFIFCI